MTTATQLAGQPRQRKPWVKKKSDWCQRELDQVKARLDLVRSEEVPSSNWRRVQTKMRLIDSYNAEIATWTARRDRYRAAGD